MIPRERVSRPSVEAAVLPRWDLENECVRAGGTHPRARTNWATGGFGKSARSMG
jgi:hypothetical protein